MGDITTSLPSSVKVKRVEQIELMKRLNELERVVPIYRQALEHISDAGGSGEWGKAARRALREAMGDEY